MNAAEKELEREGGRVEGGTYISNSMCKRQHTPSISLIVFVGEFAWDPDCGDGQSRPHDDDVGSDINIDTVTDSVSGMAWVCCMFEGGRC
jgi:hypothetical protein